jgi:SMC interacting uncharacterized protein involved in chromosome segregation
MNADTIEHNHCEWCNKSFVNVYVLKRHMDKCKFKKEEDQKDLENRCYKMQQTINTLENKLKKFQSIEDQIKELNSKLDCEIKKKEEYKIELEKFKTRSECLGEQIERYELQINELYKKLTVPSNNNIVNAYSQELQIKNVESNNIQNIQHRPSSCIKTLY